MIRIAPMLVCLTLLSHAVPQHPGELDPRLAAVKERVSTAIPDWKRDINLAPAAVGAWDLELPDGDLARCSLFKDSMGVDPDSFMEGMEIAKPGAKLVGEPKLQKTASAIEYQLVFEVPDEGYAFVWSQLLGLRGKTALSPTLFSMSPSKDTKATMEAFTAEVKAKKALLRPAYEAHLRCAFGTRVSMKDDVASVMSGPTFPIPQGWTKSAEPTTAADWTDAGEALLTLDVVSTLEHDADALIAAATAKVSDVVPSKTDKHDVSFVDGKKQVRLKVLQHDGYLYQLRASAPVATDKTKNAAFKTAIAPIFAGMTATPQKPAEKKPAKGEKK